MELTAETKYQLLLQISHKIRDTLDLDEILNHLLDMVQSVIDYDAAGIFVLNEELVHPPYEQPRDLIASVVWRGFDQRPPGADPMLSLGKGIIGHVIRTGESVVITDVRLDSRYVEGRKGTLSEITVPIVRGDRATGALNLESDKAAAYNDRDVEILRFFADAAAISIEKAMLHRQILEKERVEEQLSVAQDVQSRLLPDKSPNVPGYDIDGTCISTYEVGGDYFDYIRLPNDRIGIIVADVSGKGIPAALMMAAFRALLRTQARSDAGPAHIANTLNRLLPDFTGMEDFVTSTYGVLNPLDGRFTYVNCGHNPPMLIRADSSTESLKVGGPLLSILEDVSYDAFEVTLAPGDMLLLYTDGVVDVAAKEGEEFGVERLKEVVCRSLELPVKEIIGEIVRITQDFCGSKSYHDDFTLVLIRRKQLTAA
ncbi:MAG: SpoIIE family protein phosphatase [Candidatus Latescibacteria bacterium]|nr:SpoIIE family protein phosphatase [Candidatus Latescibacterota bacterium]